MTQELHCYDYVNRPYWIVRSALTADPRAVFERATCEGAKRVKETASKLRIEIGPVELGAEVDIVVREIEERRGGKGQGSITTMKLELSASHSPELFPKLEATLAIYPLTPTETQIDLQGTYAVPLGPLGNAVDAVVGHRLAHASVNRFVTDVAALLRQELPR
jgi:hypothetical protein